MTITEIQNNAKTKMEKTKDVLRSDLMAIRAGRANPQLLDRITVDYYGTPTPLKNVANISAPEPRVLQINPWDAKMVISPRRFRPATWGLRRPTMAR